MIIFGLIKIFKIYEMILVRHGLMIIGDTISGKTSSYKSLARTLTQLANTTQSDEFIVN